MERVYVAAQFDVPGVVAANTFMSFFMPATSPKFALPLLVTCLNYSSGQTTTPNSMTIRRISAASAGTLIAANTIPRFVENEEDPVMEVRIGNPTVITNNRIPLVAYPPPISTGAGTGSATSQQAPGGVSFSIVPGSGIAFQTAAGNVNQMWNFQLIWEEVYLPPAS